MSDYEQSLVELKELEIEVQHAKDRADAQRKEIARRFSPVKHGDIVKVNGISHKGQWMKVSGVLFSDKKRFLGGSFRAVGNVLKANGEPGARNAESFYRYGDEPERPDQ